MNVMIWLSVGAAIGWMANRIMRADGRQELALNVVLGVVGALGGGWLLSPLVGADTARQHGLGASLVASFAGAMVLLVIVNLIRQITAGGD